MAPSCHGSLGGKSVLTIIDVGAGKEVPGSVVVGWRKSSPFARLDREIFVGAAISLRGPAAHGHAAGRDVVVVSCASLHVTLCRIEVLGP
jgi:hypothetical protein